MFRSLAQVIVNVANFAIRLFVPQPYSFFLSLSHYTPLSTFADQAHAGMSSNSFNIEVNTRDGDSTAGLGERGVHRR
jgi:hypothetical protein